MNEEKAHEVIQRLLTEKLLYEVETVPLEMMMPLSEIVATFFAENGEIQESQKEKLELQEVYAENADFGTF